MKGLNCPCCGSSENTSLKLSAKAHYYNSDKTFDYYFCKHCILIWRDLAVKPDHDLYSSDYYSFNYPAAYNKFSPRQFLKYILFNLNFRFNINIYRDRQYILYRVIGDYRFPKNIRVLDVGSGNGMFLKNLLNVGYKNLTGIDPFLSESPKTNHIVLKGIGIEELEEKFDLINVHHVIEHSNNPRNFLGHVARCLSIHGKAIITFPAYGKVLEFNQAYSYLIQAPQHNFLLSYKSFSAFCASAGLKVEYFEVDNRGIFNWIVIGELWRRGVNVTEYDDDYLSNFTKEEVNSFRSISDEYERTGNGVNFLFVVSLD